jgi:membrane protein implicated in regulation of membrane protease activity
MARLAIIVGGCVLIAAGIVVLFPEFNWQGAIFLFAVGVGLLLFAFKGS